METTEMTLAEFEDLAFAHGPNLSDWPDAAQGGAVMFVEASPEAQALLNSIANLQSVLAASRPEDPAPSVDLMSRILADAATALPAPFPAPTPRPARSSLVSRIWNVFSPAAACAASAAFGLWLGYAGPVDLTDIADETFGLAATEEFAMLDDVGISPIAGVIDLLEASQ